MTLTTSQQSEITAKVRHPRLLVKISLDENEIRLASGGNVTFDGQTYSKSGVSIDQVKNGKGGVLTARVHVPNPDYVYSLLAVSGTGFHYKPIEVWQYYGTGNPSTDDVKKIIDGEIYHIPKMGDKMVFDCSLSGAMTRMIPDGVLNAPDLNHMPYPGQTFVVGFETWTVEAG